MLLACDDLPGELRSDTATVGNPPTDGSERRTPLTPTARAQHLPIAPGQPVYDKIEFMCTACGLPTTHTSFLQSISLTILLGSGVIAFLWVYYVMTSAFIKRLIRRGLDRLFTNKDASRIVEKTD